MLFPISLYLPAPSCNTAPRLVLPSVIGLPHLRSRPSFPNLFMRPFVPSKVNVNPCPFNIAIAFLLFFKRSACRLLLSLRFCSLLLLAIASLFHCSFPLFLLPPTLQGPCALICSKRERRKTVAPTLLLCTVIPVLLLYSVRSCPQFLVTVSCRSFLFFPFPFPPSAPFSPVGILVIRPFCLLSLVSSFLTLVF